MKHVRKSEEPASFIQWKSQANENWTPSYAVLQNPEKRELHESLLREQGFVCCYCGRDITPDNSHIEHFRPQEHYSALELEYANLHASCLRQLAPPDPVHCGHAKANSFDEKLTLSPLDATCERHFKYTLDGQILPDNEAAHYTSALLKLDISFLKNRREEALAGVYDETFLDTASAQELELIASRFRQPDQNGRVTSFGHVIARYAEQLLNVS